MEKPGAKAAHRLSHQSIVSLDEIVSSRRQSIPTEVLGFSNRLMQSTREFLIDDANSNIGDDDKVPPDMPHHQAELHREASGFKVAVRETRAVYWLRFSTIFVLIASMICVAFAFHRFIKLTELDAFESSFETDADKVFEALSTSLFLTLGAVDNFLVSLVSLARYTNQTWPFVTIPDYAVRLAKVRSHSKAVVVQQSHFVTLEQRAEWEQYTLDHDDWVTKSLMVQKSDPTFQGAIFANFTSDGVIHSFMGPSTGDGPFLPTWQSSPVIPVFSVYNWNALDYTSVSDAFDALVTGQRVVISKVSNQADPSSELSIAETNAATEYIADFVGDDTDPTEPFSVINFPIIDIASDRVAIFNTDGTTEVPETEVLGLVTIMFFWKNLLQDVVPNQDGVICVIQNQCNQIFSYEVNGPEVVYLGARDAHDPKYSGFVHTVEIADLGQYSPTAKAYSGIPLTGEVCAYTLQVYPSDKFKDQFTTSDPGLFSGLAVAIFVFCSLVFLCYDICVERRQRKVLSSALKSKENVTLLEDMVSERTRKLRASNQQLEEANARVIKASAAQLEHFACMSHEIRTPLNCIIGLSSLLTESGLTPMQEESMRMIVNSGDLLLAVVNDILDYSKLESDNTEVVVKRSNLQESLTAVIQSIEAKACPKNLRVKAIFDPHVPEFVEMDTRRIQQILFNLLGNAIRFSYPNSQIVLTVKLVTSEQTLPLLASHDEGTDSTSPTSSVITAASNRSSTKPQAPAIQFSVKNFGQGIEERDFGRIFQPFRQANAETERVYGGTGLGLAICSKIASKMDGTISVESKEGEWAEFHVKLPFVDTPVDLGSISKSLSDSTILFVLDDLDSAAELKNLFECVGVDMKSFVSTEALAEFAGGVGPNSLARFYLCLIHEDLYREEPWKQLSSRIHTSLLTFGPKYCVPESKWHIRSILHQLPSVLLQQLVKFAGSEMSSSSRSIVGSTRSLRSSVSLRTNDIVCHEELSVLVAEDNRINQKVLNRILTSLGLKHIDIVENGKLAVEREAAKEYDVIFMDYQMPVMDGIEATKLIIRRDDIGHPVPTIAFLTAHAAEEFEKQATEAGAAYFLTKPFSKNDISEFFKLLPALQCDRG